MLDMELSLNNSTVKSNGQGHRCDMASDMAPRAALIAALVFRKP